jgi:hypothetical protein
MTTPTPADRLALAVCLTRTCLSPCSACRNISWRYSRELAAILRERHGHSQTADWLDGIGEYQPTTETP